MADLPQRERRIQTICLLVLTSIGIAGALYWLRPVMIPFVFSVFIAFGLSPFVNVPVRRFGVPRSIAIAATLLLAFLLLQPLFWVIRNSKKIFQV